MNIPAGKWAIDPSHSSVGFQVKHLMVSKVRGSFGKFTGVATTGEDLSQLNLEAEVDTTSISTGDANRDAHLRGEDFFDVEKYPTLSFKATGVERTKHDDEVKLIGDLTIHGVTKQVVFDVEIGGIVTDPYGQTKGAAEATATIKRSDFGLTWNAALETGGVLVSDDVKIFVETQAILQA